MGVFILLYYFFFDLYKNLVCLVVNVFGIIFIIWFLIVINKWLWYWVILLIFLECLIIFVVCLICILL